MRKLTAILLTAMLLCGCAEGKSENSKAEPVTFDAASYEKEEDIICESYYVRYEDYEEFINSTYSRKYFEEGFIPYKIIFDEEKYTLTLIQGERDYYTYSVTNNETGVTFQCQINNSKMETEEELAQAAFSRDPYAVVTFNEVEYNLYRGSYAHLTFMLQPHYIVRVGTFDDGMGYKDVEAFINEISFEEVENPMAYSYVEFNSEAEFLESDYSVQMRRRGYASYRPAYPEDEYDLNKITAQDNTYTYCFTEKSTGTGVLVEVIYNTFASSSDDMNLLIPNQLNEFEYLTKADQIYSGYYVTSLYSDVVDYSLTWLPKENYRATISLDTPETEVEDLMKYFEDIDFVNLT